MYWRILPLLWLFVALAQFNRYCISVAGMQIIKSEILSDKQMGLVYSAFLLLYTIFMIPGGWLIDWLGPRAAWILVGFGSAAGACLTGLTGIAFAGGSTLLVSLLIVRALMGAANSPLHPCGARLVANWVPPKDASWANGSITCAAVVGISSQYLVFGTLMDSCGWPNAFLIMGCVTTFVAILWTFIATDYPTNLAAQNGQPRPRSPRLAHLVAETAELLRNRNMRYLALSYAMLNYFEYLLFYWVGDFLEKNLHMSVTESRFYSTMLALAMGAGMAVGGWLSDFATRRLGHLGRAVVPAGGLVLCALFFTIGAFVDNSNVVIVTFAVAAAAAGAGEGAFWTAAVEVGGLRGGTAAAILNTGGNAGGLLAPALTPFIADYFSWTAALLAASANCIIGAALWFGIRIDRSGDEKPPLEPKAIPAEEIVE